MDKTNKPPACRGESGGARMVDLTHARHDRAHVLAPGLFRSLAPGERKKLKLDVTYNFGAREQIEFRGFEPLGVLEMRVLQGLVAMAGPDGLVLDDHDRAGPAGGQLMLDLFEPDPIVMAAKLKPASLVVQDSFRRLAREIGMDEGGASVKKIRMAVERMFGVTIFVQSSSGKRLGMRLLAGYASDESTGDLYVALNPRIAAAVMGNTPHARIDLAEVRQLKSDPSTPDPSASLRVAGPRQVWRSGHRQACWIRMARTLNQCSHQPQPSYARQKSSSRD